MKCPACRHELSAVNTRGIILDVCEGGCGGIWFDHFELQKFDEPHETIPEDIAHPRFNPEADVDPAPERRCPRCEGVVMLRFAVEGVRHAQLDNCPSCGGYWLDAGELTLLRSQFKPKATRPPAPSPTAAQARASASILRLTRA